MGYRTGSGADAWRGDWLYLGRFILGRGLLLLSGGEVLLVRKIMANKCSREAQRVVKEGVWYYENPGSIDLVVRKKWFDEKSDEKSHYSGAIIRISRRKLEASLKRMNASRRKRK